MQDEGRLRTVHVREESTGLHPLSLSCLMGSSDQNQPLPSLTRSQAFQANYASLDAVRDFVAQAAVECGLAEDAVYAVQLAMDEAFTNIIEHSLGGECDEDIQCSCTTGDEVLVVMLQDCGRPFNPGSVPEPDLKSDLQDRDVGGLGLYFMRKLMDEVHFSFTELSDGGVGCNTVTMIKRKGR